ncbi:hypothetical protein SETIT_5G464100v2 [Setaria italica]|uniref:Uncharacterized protein n=1 Tax=Setaria italica TaxID=4555 RepID=A0A368RGJ0_SETIT|nr:hypothetical protein SETIT_5G464100v2 [Setaria italica]
MPLPPHIAREARTSSPWCPHPCYIYARPRVSVPTPPSRTTNQPRNKLRKKKIAAAAAMAGQQSTRMVAMLLAALVVAAASLPAATAYGCYDDCYERCANGKDDPVCTKMCNQACGPDDQGGAAAAPTA